MIYSISEPIYINKGIRHGCGLSPVLFNISSSSSSSGAEPPLIGDFGLLNDILPLCSVLDAG